MKRLSLILSILILNVSIGMSQDTNVTLDSVIVQEDGHILLAWTVSGGFMISGSVKRLSPGGATEMTFPIGPGQTTFLDVLVDGNSRSYSYNLDITAGMGTGLLNLIEGIESIHLETSNNQNTVCDLSWNRNSFITGKSPGTDLSNPVYHHAYIYRKHPKKNDYDIIDTIDHTYLSGKPFFPDAVPSVCDDTLKYYVEYRLSSGTKFRSNTSKIRFDSYNVGNRPATPEWNNISVHPVLQRLNLTWEPNTNANIIGFEICKGEPCAGFDTVWGKDVFSYECANCDPEQIHNFKIKSIDGCNAVSAWSDVQNNIVLNAVVTACPKEVDLSWNAYHNMQGDLGGYNIYAKFDGGGYHIIHKTDPGVTKYSYEIPEEVSLANIYVAAVNKSQTIEATSNITTSFFGSTKNLVEVLYASVAEDNKSIQFSISVDNSVASGSYNFYRGIDDAEPVLYKTITPGNNLSFEIVDDEVAAEKHIYTYYLKTSTGCSSVKTVPMRTTLVQTGDIVTVKWNPYVGWEDIDSYHVERKRVKPGAVNPTWDPLISVDESVLSFDDDASSFDDGNERIFYRVISYNKANINTKATSSVSEYIKDGIVQVPNVFTPKGMQGAANTTFKPKTLHVSDVGYAFVIYNRWGEIVFQTNNIEEGWDGKFRGNFCPPGAYIYSVKYIYRTGKTETRTGTVLIIE